MRRVFHENVVTILEELQGATVTPTAMPTPGKPAAKGKGAQQVAAGAQQMANGVQAAANNAAAAGDQSVRADMAHQQGMDPKQQAQANKNLAAQPKPSRVTPSAAARGMQADANQNRARGASGKPVQANEAETETAPKLTPAAAAEDAANPDDKASFNDDPADKRPAARAKEIFPGTEKNVPAGYGKDGAGRPQGHHEVTPGGPLTTKRPSEVAEGVLSEEERTKLLDGVFNA